MACFSAPLSFSSPDGFVNYVSVDIDKYRRNTKAVKKTLSMPAWLAEEAEEKHINLSKFLQDGLKEKFGY
jgi:antitoxin HicB